MSRSTNEVGVENVSIYINESLTGDIGERFLDENFVFDLLKLLCDDAVDVVGRCGLLVSLEEFGSVHLDTDSADQIISSLLNIFLEAYKKNDSGLFSCQLLITATNLLIQADLLDSGVSIRLSKILLDIISKVNKADGKQLRGCSCQCLLQLEQFHPGCLTKNKDAILQMAKDERTDVCQDYLQLVSVILRHCCTTQQENGVTSAASRNVSRSMSGIDSQEVRQIVSYLIENSAVMTVPGLWNVTQELISIVQTESIVSSLIFKPMILHHSASVDPALFHLVLYIQRIFGVDLLTETEAHGLLQRVTCLVNHPSLTPAQRLLTMQWLPHLVECKTGTDPVEWTLPDLIVQKKWAFYPVIFDGIDIQSAKLRILSHCFKTDEKYADLVAVILQKSLTYIQVLVKQAVTSRVVLALLKIIFSFHRRHASPQMAQYIKNMVLDIATDSPQFIPHVINFIQVLYHEVGDRQLYIDILKSLHNQVVGSTTEHLVLYFDFYLEVLKISTQEEEIHPQSSVKFLSELENRSCDINHCEWSLGQAVLNVCRNILMYHASETYFSDLGDLLHHMLTTYEDIDICDKARFYYGLLMLSSDKKIKEILTTSDGEGVTHALTTFLPGTGPESNKTEIIKVDSELFHWKRDSVIMNSLDIQEISVPDTSLSLLEGYHNKVREMCAHLIIRMKLEMSTDCECDTAYAVTVTVHPNNCLDEVTDCHIPCISKGEVKDICLKVKLKKPCPFVIQSSAIFATLDDHTCSTQLSDIEVTFKDIFNGLPWNIADCTSEESKVNFFKLLWDNFTNEENKTSVESVKVLNLNAQKFVERIKSELPRITYLTGDKEHWYGVFLPPSNHLLIKVKDIPKKSVISIATDCWRILPDVNDLLEQIV